MLRCKRNTEHYGLLQRIVICVASVQFERTLVWDIYQVQIDIVFTMTFHKKVIQVVLVKWISFNMNIWSHQGTKTTKTFVATSEQQKFPVQHTQNREPTGAPEGWGLEPGGFYTQKATASNRTNSPPSHPIIAILTATTVTPKPLRFNVLFDSVKPKPLPHVRPLAAHL